MQVERHSHKGRILIVDDNPLILETLRSILAARDFEVASASDGNEALSYLQSNDTDVVISDVMMPNCDGYQLFESVRADERLAHLPFIFLTALDDMKEIVKGTRTGCDSYLTKPFDPYLLLSTVEGKVARSKALKQVMQDNQDSYRKRVVQTLSHEFRTPLVAINTGSEILKEQAKKLEPAKISSLIDAIYRGGQRLERLVQDFMTLQHIEAGMALKMAQARREEISIRRVLKDFYQTVKDDYQNEGRELLFIETGADTVVFAFETQIRDTLQRLIQNAFKFSPVNTAVEVWCETDENTASIVVADRGQGLSAVQAQNAIDAFKQLNRDKIEQQGAGLGLFIAHSLCSFNGAELQFHERQDGGTLACICFKLNQD